MITLPATMRAIDPAEAGGPEVLVEVERPVPTPGSGEVLVRVAVAGVNRPDVLQRTGNYPLPPGAPTIPGLEIAGEIVAIGPDTPRWKIGDKVCALIVGGGYAEYAVAVGSHCLPVPEGVSMADAAALPETLFTVWHNVFQRGGARAGERVLVHGGTSGIGTTALALAKLFDLEMIVTAGSDDKCRRALELGAAHAINYRTQDFVEEVTRITGGKGVELILDMVGGDYVPRNLQCLAVEGRHVTIATQRGGKAEIPIGQVMIKRQTLTGSTLRPRDTGFKAALAADIEAKLWHFVADGRLRPVMDASFPLAEAANAHRRLDEDHVGKVVLTLD